MTVWSSVARLSTRLRKPDAQLYRHESSFFQPHRAAEDCLAALQILRLPLPKSWRSPISYLLQASRAITCRIKAPNTPYERKELLKARSYRWSDGSDGSQKAWWIDVPEDKLQEEIAFLQSENLSAPGRSYRSPHHCLGSVLGKGRLKPGSEDRRKLVPH